MKKAFTYFVFIVILYLFLFDPPMYMFRGQLRFSNILLVVASIYNIYNLSTIKKFFRNYNNEFYLFSILFLFIILRCALELETAYINKTLMAFLNIFMVVPFLLHFAKRYGFGSEEQVVRALMITCTIATSITIVCLINPAIHNYIKFVVLQMNETDYLYNNEYRGFGLASLLTSNYGFVLGFVAGIGCYYLKGNKWFIVCVPFMILAAMVNSRTSALVASAVLFVFLFFSKQKGYAFLMVFVGILFFNYFDTIIQLLNFSDRTYEWIMSFQNQVVSVVESGDIYASRTGSEIFGSMVIWPASLEQWFLGRGYDIFVERLSLHSDNGWIRQLNFGGLIYIALFYSVMIALLHRLSSSKQVQYVLIFVLVFSIVNTKTMCYPGDTLFVLLMLFYFFKVKPNSVKYGNKKDNNSSSLLQGFGGN